MSSRLIRLVSAMAVLGSLTGCPSGDGNEGAAGSGGDFVLKDGMKTYTLSKMDGEIKAVSPGGTLLVLNGALDAMFKVTYEWALVKNGTLMKMGPLPKSMSESAALSLGAINDNDEFVGRNPTGLTSWRAYLCTVKDLGTLTGGGISEAKDINNKGEVVGSSLDMKAPLYKGSYGHAFLYKNGL
jgi:probable HAF family extracellular repeat protein